MGVSSYFLSIKLNSTYLQRSINFLVTFHQMENGINDISQCFLLLQLHSYLDISKSCPNEKIFLKKIWDISRFMRSILSFRQLIFAINFLLTFYQLENKINDSSMCFCQFDCIHTEYNKPCSWKSSLGKQNKLPVYRNLPTMQFLHIYQDL